VETLRRVLESAASAATRCRVRVVTGDTKVVPRGAADGLFVNTSGIGAMILPAPAGPTALQPEDELVVSGPIGRHGVSILAARERLGFDPQPVSDCGSLVPLVQALRDAGIPIRSMRDATRGGVATVLHEWAERSGCTLTIDEALIPVTPEVRGACELLGLDPVHLANEGTMVVAVERGAGSAAVKALHAVDKGQRAACVGKVSPRSGVPVTIRRAIGREQPLDEPRGAPLPRIC